MLTTIIYRSHLRDDAPSMRLRIWWWPNLKNKAIWCWDLLLTAVGIFPTTWRPREQVKEIYRCICNDPRHYNIVELMCDYAPAPVREGRDGVIWFTKTWTGWGLTSCTESGTSNSSSRMMTGIAVFPDIRTGDRKSTYFKSLLPISGDFITDNSGTPLIKQSLRQIPTTLCLSTNYRSSHNALSLWKRWFVVKMGNSSVLWQIKHGRDVHSDLESKDGICHGQRAEPWWKMLSVNLLPMTLVNRPTLLTFWFMKCNGLVPCNKSSWNLPSEVISTLMLHRRKSLKASGICGSWSFRRGLCRGYCSCLVSSRQNKR